MQASQVEQASNLKLVVSNRSTPLDLAIQSYLLDCEARRLSGNTLTNYGKPLRALHHFLDVRGVMRPQDITASHLRAFLVELQTRHNAGGVFWHYRVVKSFLRFLVAEGDIGHNPLDKVKPPKLPQDLQEPVSLESVAKMLTACVGDLAERDSAILLTLLDSGLRAAEILALDIGDVDIATGRVVVKHGKGDKARVVFLGARARRAIIKMLRSRADIAPTEPLFTTDDGGRLTYWGLRQILRRRAAAANVSVPSAHDFRRAFALLSLRGGCDIMSLQRLMGHADLTVLRRYLAQTEADLQAAHAKSSPVDKML